MHPVDWFIVLGLFMVLAMIAYRTKRHMRGVADFLVANRCAGRYLLTLADGMAGVGAIAFIGSFQQTYAAGLGPSWWGGLNGPLMLLLPITGFIIYRYRESRVMTIAEFYERRYSRRFRVFAGMLAWVAGIINYGVFPSVTARFFIYFCGIPVHYVQAGPFTVNVTLGIVMAILLGTALIITFRGGQIAIMVTDFLQAQFVNVVFLVVLGALLWKFSISNVVDTLVESPEGLSMVNPFDQQDLSDFNVWFFLMAAFHFVYTYMSWQGNQAYNCSAKTPHDARMARILAAWRHGATWTVIGLIPIFGYVLFNSPSFGGEAAAAQTAIENLADEALQRELTVPIALRTMLPVGVLGLFVAAMLAAAISTDDTYLHSWGSIFIQDVLVPIRGKPLEPEQHLRWLRRSILFVACFAWVFGMLFPLQEYIFMFWAITGAIYGGGAGSVIIGGFYWKRGTTAGAWAAMVVGAVLAFTGIALNNILWPFLLPALQNAYPATEWLQALPERFWLNGMQINVLTMAVAIVSYITVSLATKPKPDFSMDKLLHRGEYGIPGEHKPAAKKKTRFLNLLGVDDEFSRFDRFVASSIVAWTFLWFFVFLAGTAYGLLFETTNEGWSTYWLFHMGVYIVVGLVTVVWFLWGGFRDLADLFTALREAPRDDQDDGFVKGDAKP